MEHLEHFGLQQDPFQNNPQLAFYFASPQHSDAERRLLRGVRQGKGLSVIVGPSGSGKTTLVSHLLEGLDEDVFEASLIVMVHAGVDSKWLLTCIARQLGVEDPSGSRVQLLGQIYHQLVAIREAGRRPVILIDEAQMLTRKETQTELRGLLNLEHDEERLLSFVLSGLPELEQVLALDPPLAERVDIRVQLACLDEESASAYLAHRLRTAGGDPSLITRAAAAEIARRASGIPRRLNTLADNALFEAYLAGHPRVEAEDVARAAEDLAWARDPRETVAPAPAPAPAMGTAPAAAPTPSAGWPAHAAPAAAPGYAPPSQGWDAYAPPAAAAPASAPPAFPTAPAGAPPAAATHAGGAPPFHAAPAPSAPAPPPPGPVYGADPGWADRASATPQPAPAPHVSPPHAFAPHAPVPTPPAQSPLAAPAPPAPASTPPAPDPHPPAAPVPTHAPEAPPQPLRAAVAPDWAAPEQTPAPAPAAAAPAAVETPPSVAPTASPAQEGPGPWMSAQTRPAAQSLPAAQTPPGDAAPGMAPPPERAGLGSEPSVARDERPESVEELVVAPQPSSDFDASSEPASPPAEAFDLGGFDDEPAAATVVMGPAATGPSVADAVEAVLGEGADLDPVVGAEPLGPLPDEPENARTRVLAGDPGSPSTAGSPEITTRQPLSDDTLDDLFVNLVERD